MAKHDLRMQEADRTCREGGHLWVNLGSYPDAERYGTHFCRRCERMGSPNFGGEA